MNDDLIPRLDRMSSAEFDQLPLGLIQLDAEGRILRFNRKEGELARRDPRAQLGKSFFDEVAPCTKVRAFYGRFREGLARKQLHETFAFTFHFPFGTVDVAVTLFYSQATSSVWVLVSRNPEDVAAARARVA